MTYTERQIFEIRTLRDAGQNWEFIAKMMNKNAKSLRSWWSRNKINFDLPPKTVVKKRKTDGRVGSAIKRVVAEKPTLPIRDIPAELKKIFGEEMDLPKKTCIQEFLALNQFKVINLKQKQFISRKIIDKRLQFAQDNIENLDSLVNRTIWSDETTVRKHPKNQILLYRCHQTTPQEDLPYNYQLQNGGFSVMFWGCFSNLGLGPLVALDGNQNQHTYVELLKTYLIPEIQAAYATHGIKMVFMQDNAPGHKTKKVMDYITRQEVAVLDWPPQSPDLNPIENLWAIIEKRRQKNLDFEPQKLI